MFSQVFALNNFLCAVLLRFTVQIIFADPSDKPKQRWLLKTGLYRVYIRFRELKLRRERHFLHTAHLPPSTGAFVCGLCLCNQHTSVLHCVVLVPVVLVSVWRNDMRVAPRVVTAGLLVQARWGVIQTGEGCWSAMIVMHSCLDVPRVAVIARTPVVVATCSEPDSPPRLRPCSCWPCRPTRTCRSQRT